MALSWAQVLLLPLDVSNARGGGLGMRMDLLWIIVYIASAVFILILVPLCTFYYESDPDWSFWDKFKYSLCYLLAFIVVVALILVICYIFLSVVRALFLQLNRLKSLLLLQIAASPTFKIAMSLLLKLMDAKGIKPL